MKRIISAITLIALLMAALCACSSDTESGYSGNGDLTYADIDAIEDTDLSYFIFTVTGDTAVLKSFKSDGDYPTSIRIPSEYNGMKVTAISEECFANCTELVNVVLPSTVYSIGARAFYNCTSLKAVVLTESVRSFGDAVFYGCSSLQYIKLPKSLTSIGSGIFSACLNLQRIFVYEKSTAYTHFSESGFKLELQVIE